jgi:hypothetical protein
VGPACSMSDPVKLFLYQLEASSSTASCPCAATQCCFLGTACVDP